MWQLGLFTDSPEWQTLHARWSKTALHDQAIQPNNQYIAVLQGPFRHTPTSFSPIWPAPEVTISFCCSGGHRSMAVVVGCLLIAALLFSQVGLSQQTAGALITRAARAVLKSNPITRYIYTLYENAKWALDFSEFLWTSPSHREVATWLVRNPPPLLDDLFSLQSWILDYLAQICDYYNLPRCKKSVKLVQYVVWLRNWYSTDTIIRIIKTVFLYTPFSYY